VLIGDSGVGKSCLLLRFAVRYYPLHRHAGFVASLPAGS
jgi:GTPase SAR1 family protein